MTAKPARTICFLGLLLICLAIAPARLILGDRMLLPMPAIEGESAPTSDRGQSFAELCEKDPVAALARSIQRYKQDVEGYTCMMAKQERINGKLNNPELIRCDFRESPFSVRMYWEEGRGRALALLYPAEDRRDRLVVVPANELARKVVPFVTRGLEDREVRQQSRYPITEFGMQAGTVRAHAAMAGARARGQLDTRYDGLKPIPELGGKLCHVLHRFSEIPEEDGQTHLTMCFDPDTLLQVGVIVRAGEELVATYFFRDVVLNPKFEPSRFTIESLK